MIAQRLAESCPAELGDEIAVTGSVALGVADEASDVELNLWCDALPAIEQRASWIAAVGGEVRSNRAESWSDGTLETVFRVEGVWVEAGWMTKARLEETLRGILAAETIDHGRLQMAWVVEMALELRTGGLLKRWRRELAAYPETLREKLIEANTRVWQTPHAMAGRWTYCRRHQPLALAERLTWDTYNLLRLVFALNRRWEPDMKWLREVTRELPVAPERMAERIERVFAAPALEERVRTSFELIRDALALAPASAGIERARETIEGCLAREGTRVGSGRVAGSEGEPYAPGDLPAVTELLLRCRAAGRVEEYPSAAELRLIVPGAPEETANARVWRAGGDPTPGSYFPPARPRKSSAGGPTPAKPGRGRSRAAPAAFALFDPHWRSLTFFVGPELAVRDAAAAVLEWGMGMAAASPPAGGAAWLRVRPRDADREVVALLEERGFVREEGSTLRYARDLREPIPGPRLPAGYTIRHLRGEEELDAYCAMHRDAFGTEYMTVERRLPLLRDPGYDPELDLVAVAPDGELAAFVYCSVDAEENERLELAQGWTDPVGTRPAHRRRGLSTALVLEGFRRLRARGVDRALTGTGEENRAMQGVCAAVGYRLLHRCLSYAWAAARG